MRILSREYLILYGMHRAPAAGAVQKASADLVANWGKLAEKWVLAEQRASEQFFSREFAPLVPRGAGVHTKPHTHHNASASAIAGSRARPPAIRACSGAAAQHRRLASMDGGMRRCVGFGSGVAGCAAVLLG